MGTGSRGTAASRSRPVAATWAMVLAALLVFTSAPVAAEDVKRVLVLYPVSDGQPGILRFDEGLRSALKARPDTRVEIYNEYLDAARFPDERHQRHLAEFLRGKYSGRRPDVIIPGARPVAGLRSEVPRRSLPRGAGRLRRDRPAGSEGPEFGPLTSSASR